MGTKNSKLVRHSSKAKDNKASAKLDETAVVVEPKSQSPIDARLPLDTRQKFRLQKSWKGIKRNMTETAVELIIR